MDEKRDEPYVMQVSRSELGHAGELAELGHAGELGRAVEVIFHFRCPSIFLTFQE